MPRKKIINMEERPPYLNADGTLNFDKYSNSKPSKQSF